MERGNTKHGVWVDEQLAQEAPEPPDEEQLTRFEGGAPPGMTYEEVEERSRLGRYIPRQALPGDREALILGANDLDAPEDIVEQLASLPAGETYGTVAEVWAALGHHNEERRT